MQTSEEPPTDDKDIALALALSESEARQREENIIAQEEADLMKALEESRLSDSGYNRYVYDSLFDERQDFQEGPSSSSQPSASVSSSPGKTFLNPGTISAHSMSRQHSEDESFLHMITPTTSEYSSDMEDFVHRQSIERQDSSQSAVDDSRSNRDYSTPTPPPYADVVSTVKLDDDTKSCGTPSSMCSTPVEFPRASDHVRPSPAPNPAHPYLMSSPQPITPELPPQPRRPSLVHSESSSSSGRSSMSENSLLSFISKSSQSALMSSRVSVGSSYQLDSVDEGMQEDEDDDEGTDPNARPGPALTANQYVEPEMLMGICKYSFSSASPPRLIELCSDGFFTARNLDGIVTYGNSYAPGHNFTIREGSNFSLPGAYLASHVEVDGAIKWNSRRANCRSYHACKT
jgi:hypothetical protein